MSRSEPDVIPTWVPPAARQDAHASQWWVENPFKRAIRHIYASRALLRDDFVVMLRSFTKEQLVRAIELNLDLVPLMIETGRLDDSRLKPIAKAILYNNGAHLLEILRGRDGRGPREIVYDLYTIDREKGELLLSEKGWKWFNAATWKIAAWVYHFAELRGEFWYPRPEGVDSLTPVRIAISDDASAPHAERASP